MSLVTRVTKYPQTSQEWTAAELNPNDIIGVYESLGNRNARSVTVVSKGGPTIIRFNVIDQIFPSQGDVNSWIPFAGSFKTPYLLHEVVQVRTDHFIDAGATWQEEGLSVKDIQIIQFAPMGIITVF